MTYDMNHHCNVIREVQHITWQRTPNTGLIVTYDTNSNGSIHPEVHLLESAQLVGLSLRFTGIKVMVDAKVSDGPVCESHKMQW